MPYAALCRTMPHMRVACLRFQFNVLAAYNQLHFLSYNSGSIFYLSQLLLLINNVLLLL